MSKVIRIDTINIGDKRSCSANGDGIRIIVWFAGCDIKCDLCHNEDYWDFENPKFEDFSQEHLDLVAKEMKSFPLYSGLSVLGGEPLSRNNIKDCLTLCKWFKENFPEKNIWIWSGHTYQWLVSQTGEYGDLIQEVLSFCDFLVDGPFINAQRDLSLKFRGSRNQHIWKKSEDKWEIYD